MLWRKQRAYNAVEAGIYQAEPDEVLWTEQIFHRLSLADRYRTNAERAFKRAITNVELLRKTCVAAEERELRRRRWELKLDHANRRITMQEKAFEQGREAKQAGVKLNALHKELAIAKAEDQLGIEKNKLADQAYRRACNGFDKPTFVQNIEVSVSDGHTYTMMDPDNEFLLEYVAIGSTYPIEQIVRKYLFPEGIPPEYYWMTDREDWRNEKQHTVEQAVTARKFPFAGGSREKTRYRPLPLKPRTTRGLTISMNWRIRLTEPWPKGAV